jgi:AraC-like DNA-binding protein
MSLLAAFVRDTESRVRVCDAIGRRMRVAFYERGECLVAALAEEQPRAVLLELRDERGSELAPLIGRIRQRAPASPIVIYCWLGPSVAGDILELARAGVNGLVLRGYDDVGVVLQHALERAEDDGVARNVVKAVEPLVRRRGRIILEYCVRHARDGLTVRRVAGVHGVHRNTLVVQLARAGLPPPRQVIAWSRLLVAAHLMEDPSRAVDGIALELDLASGSALRNMLRRYAGLRPSDVRARGGLACVLDAFKDTLIQIKRTSAEPT